MKPLVASTSRHFQSGKGACRGPLHDCKTSHNLTRQPWFQALLALLLTPPVCRSCYSLLSQGPCGEAEWLVLEAGHSVLCRPRLCPCDPRSDSNASRVSTVRTLGECFYLKEKTQQYHKMFRKQENNITRSRDPCRMQNAEPDLPGPLWYWFCKDLGTLDKHHGNVNFCISEEE